MKDLNTWINEYLDAKLYKASHAHAILDKMHEYYTFKEIFEAEKITGRVVRHEHNFITHIDGVPYAQF